MKPHHQIILCQIQDTCQWVSHTSVEMQSVYCTVTADWSDILKSKLSRLFLPNKLIIFSRVRSDGYLSFVKLTLVIDLMIV